MERNEKACEGRTSTEVLMRELLSKMREICGFHALFICTIYEQRMMVLEQIANESIGKISSNMLMNFANRVEIHYTGSVRQEDLIEKS